MTTSIISIDWLQLYVDLHLFSYSDQFEVKQLEYGTKHFKILEEIHLQGSLFCTMQREPRSHILKANTGIVKFENSILYRADAELIITNFLHSCEIYILNITRIDIAVDFTKFKNGLLPQNLIKGFLKEKYLRNGRGKYTVIGQQKNVMDVSYLRFGTRASDVNVYLYNKSLEMREKIHKPYIAELWKQLKGGTTEDVWRLEFSLSGKATTYVNKDTGEMETITLNLLSNNKKKELVVEALEKRYFEFKINDNQKNKTRMKRLPLLNFESLGFTNQYIPSKCDIFKRDKMLLKNIYTLDKEHRNVPEHVIEAKKEIVEFIRESEYLNQYFEHKQSEWDATEFRR